MKKFLIATSVLLMTFSMGYSAGPEAQDIVIKSRLDHQSSASFIKRIRTFMINNNFGDPYNQGIKTPIKIEFDQIMTELPRETQTWIKDLQTVLNLALTETKLRLKIDSFAYSIEGFNSEVQPLSSGLNRIEYVTANYVKGLRILSNKISFEVELKRAVTGEPVTFAIELIEPEFLVSRDLMVDVPMGWNTAIMKDSLLVSLNMIDLSKSLKEVQNHPETIDLKIKDLVIPRIAVRIGNRELKLDEVKIKKFLLDRKDQMKLSLIDLLRTRMNDRFTNVIANKPVEIFLGKTFTLTGDLNTVFDLKTLNADTHSRVLEAKLDGHFCATLRDLEDGHCRSRQVDTKLRREISDQTFQQSMTGIEGHFQQKRANVAVSVSEHYLNQLVAAAIQGNMLELGGSDFKLGPETAFVLAEEKGEGFNLYVDIIYKLKGAQRVLVGRSELRFPVRMRIGLKIHNTNGTPRLVIKVLGLNTTDEMLLKGIPAFELKSNVNTVRFQKKVLAAIHEDIKGFDQKVMVDLELPEFKDTYLEELDFFSDGYGRGTAVLLMNGQKLVR